jgi:hypothetical protein
MTDRLQLIADDVAADFLAGLDTLHNLTKKVSEDSSLQSYEIERVAQLVNKEVQIRMYSENGPKGAFEFDMVDPSQISIEANSEFEDASTVKRASSTWTYERKFADKEETFSGNNQFSGDFLIESKERLELDLSELEDSINKTSQDIEDGYNKVYSIIKEALLSEDVSAPEIVAYIKQEEPALAKTAAYITCACCNSIAGRDIADQAALPDSMLMYSEPIPVDKFQGGRSMVKELNTLVRQHDRMEVQNEGYMKIRESIRYVVEGINSHLRGEIEVD